MLDVDPGYESGQDVDDQTWFWLWVIAAVVGSLLGTAVGFAFWI
jgi:hypothetical protein